MVPFRTTIRLCTETIFPRQCPVCDRPLTTEDSSLCPACSQAMIDITPTDYCPLCGSSVGPHLLNLSGCPKCPSTEAPYEQLVRVGIYDSPLKEIILQYKYHYQQHLDKTLAQLLAAAIMGHSWSAELDALVPVPTSWAWRLKYGCFPVGLLANCAGRLLSLPTLSILNVRGKKKRQMELPESKRAANVRGVFHLAKHANVKNKNLCIIDDVATTCSTIRETARILKKAGAGRVYAAVLAKTDHTFHNP